MPRPPSANSLLKKAKQVELKTPISDDMFLPNYSGIEKFNKDKPLFLNIDGSNANQNIDIGGWDFTCDSSGHFADLYVNSGDITLEQGETISNSTNGDIVFGGTGGGALDRTITFDLDGANATITADTGLINFVSDNLTTTGTITGGTATINGTLTLQNGETITNSVNGVIELGGAVTIEADSTTALRVRDSSETNIFWVDTIGPDTTMRGNLLVLADAANVLDVRSNDNTCIVAVDTRAATSNKYCYYRFEDGGATKYGFIYTQSSQDFYMYDYINSKVFFKYDQSVPEVEIGQADGTIGIKMQGNTNFLSYDITTTGIIDWSGATHQKPKIYSATTEPNIALNSTAFWNDTSTGKYWLILDIAGTQKKVELT